jgi:hypothetical protein
MAKIPFNDVTPPNRRSIRNIPIPSGGKRKISNNSEVKINITDNHNVASSGSVRVENQTPNFDINKGAGPKISDVKIPKQAGAYEYYYPKNNIQEPLKINDYSNNDSRIPKTRKFMFGGIAIVFILIFIFGMMTVFATATVTVVPRSLDLDVSTNIKAVNNPVGDGVRYEIIRLSKSKNTSVEATGEEEAEVKASGRIMIYNNYSTDPQRLIIRTRFESPEGLIYRIPESVVVPGKTTKDGKDVPGSVEVEVFADEPGQKYNIKNVDFTIPGFKNDPAMYSAFYARSVTDMAGGFIGKRKTVSNEAKQSAMLKIEAELRDEIKRDLQAKIPDNLVFLEDAIYYESFDLPQQEESSSVLVGLEVVAYVTLFNKEDLTQKISEEYLLSYEDWSGIGVNIPNFTNLMVSDGIDKNDDLKDLELKIDGKLTLFANIESNLLADKLVGLSRKQAQYIMDDFPGISSIKASIRPVWKKSFPNNAEKIKVNISLIK